MSRVSVLSEPAEWKPFLESFAAALQTDEWPGNPRASEEQLLNAESRLKIKLPPSYRAFLLVSNGWRNASDEVPVLRPVEKIRWFMKEHRDWVKAYTDPMQGTEPLLPAEQDYFNYANEESANFDVKHLAHTLCISDEGDSAVLLLNPMVVWPDGEWETWFFANWLPGATRYRSFADWMRHELAGLTDDPFVHSVVPGELPTVYLDGPAKPTRRVRPREEILTYDEVLKRLASKTKARRIKAIRQLARIGGPNAVSTLLNLLKIDDDFHIRCEAAEMLGRMRALEAVETLIAETNKQSHSTSTVIEALGNFNDEASAQCLLALVQEDGPSAGVAVHALSKRKDPRALRVLVERLVSKVPRDQHTGNIAGRLIAMFETPGFLALEPLVAHEDVEIRRRALNGIYDLAFSTNDKELKIRARRLLQRRLEAESDEELHRHLETFVTVICKRKLPGSDA